MVFSSEFLAGIWFEIYRQVLNQNEKLGDDCMKDEQLSSVATTIFIQAGRRGYLKPAPLNNFQKELLKAVGSVTDRGIQRSIYESVKVLVNGNGVKEVLHDRN